MEINHRESKYKTAPAIVSVYDGQRCIGFVLKRARGFEAFDDAERALGTFSTIKAAADAVSEATT